VVKRSTGQPIKGGCHGQNKQKAIAHKEALYANAEEGARKGAGLDKK